MFVQFKGSGKKQLAYVAKSYRTSKGGKTSTDIVEKLGYLEDIAAAHPGVDPKEWARQRARELTILEKSQSAPVKIELNPALSIRRGRRKMKGGMLPLIPLLHGWAGVSGICKEITARSNFKFNLTDIVSMLGPIFAGFAVSAWSDWKLIFPVYAVASLLSLLWLLTAVRPDNPAGGTEGGTSLAAVWQLLKSRKILLLFTGIICTVGLDVGINTAIPKLLMERCALPLDKAGFGTSLYFFARTVGALAAVSALIFAGGLWPLAALIVVVGFMWANVFSIIFTFALETAPGKSDEVSALMITGLIGGALIPPLMGIAADAGGLALSLLPLWLCAAWLLILSLLHR